MPGQRPCRPPPLCVRVRLGCLRALHERVCTCCVLNSRLRAGHRGEWRDPTSPDRKKYCSLPGDPDGRVCEHSSGIVKSTHWSCCGSTLMVGRGCVSAAVFAAQTRAVRSCMGPPCSPTQAAPPPPPPAAPAQGGQQPASNGGGKVSVGVFSSESVVHVTVLEINFHVLLALTHWFRPCLIQSPARSPLDSHRKCTDSSCVCVQTVELVPVTVVLLLLCWLLLSFWPYSHAWAIEIKSWL